MTFRGRALVYGDHVNTDLVIAGRYCHLPTAEAMAAHCLEDLDPTFVQRLRPGDVLVAGLNFGCGSSREEAPAVLKAAGVSCVVARTFARIFFRNAFNIGLPILEVPAVDRLRDGDEVAVDPGAGTVTVVASGEVLRGAPVPDFMRELVARGGLVADALARLAGKRTGGAAR